LAFPGDKARRSRRLFRKRFLADESDFHADGGFDDLAGLEIGLARKGQHSPL